MMKGQQIFKNPLVVDGTRVNYGKLEEEQEYAPNQPIVKDNDQKFMKEDAL